MVTVASPVWRALRSEAGFVSVLVKSELPLEEAVRVVKEILDEAGASTDDVDELAMLDLQETTVGPAVVLRDCAPPDAPAVIQRLSERLTAHGLGGATLTLMPTVKVNGKDPDRAALIKCWLALRGERPQGWADGVRWSTQKADWVVTEADRDEAVDYLVEWAVSLEGKGLKAAVSVPDHKARG